MSYPAGTILKRDEPYADIDVTVDTENGLTEMDKQPHPLNEVEVVGPSPISTSTVADWNGIRGDALIVRPNAVFGANEVAPVTVLQSEYSVVSLGDPDEVRKEVTITPAEKQRRLLSPEAVFAAEAKEAKTEVKRGPGRPPKESA